MCQRVIEFHKNAISELDHLKRTWFIAYSGEDASKVCLEAQQRAGKIEFLRGVVEAFAPRALSWLTP